MGLFLILLLCIDGVISNTYTGRGFISRGDYHFIGDDKGLVQELKKRKACPEYRMRQTSGLNNIDLGVPQMPPSPETKPFVVKELTPLMHEEAEYYINETQNDKPKGLPNPKVTMPKPYLSMVKSSMAQPKPDKDTAKTGTRKSQLDDATAKSGRRKSQLDDATAKLGARKPQPGMASAKSGTEKLQPSKVKSSPMNALPDGRRKRMGWWFWSWTTPPPRVYAGTDASKAQIAAEQIKAMETSIYTAQIKLKQTEWIMSKHSKDPKYRLAYIFMKLDEWQRDVHIYKDFSSYGNYYYHRHWSETTYWHLVYYGLALGRNIDATYTIDYLLELHRQQQEITKMFESDLKAQVKLMG